MRTAQLTSPETLTSWTDRDRLEQLLNEHPSPMARKYSAEGRAMHEFRPDLCRAVHPERAYICQLEEHAEGWHVAWGVVNTIAWSP